MANASMNECANNGIVSREISIQDEDGEGLVALEGFIFIRDDGYQVSAREGEREIEWIGHCSYSHHSLFNPIHSLFDPIHSLFKSFHSLFDPIHSLFNPVHSLFNPVRSLFNPFHSLTDPALHHAIDLTTTSSWFEVIAVEYASASETYEQLLDSSNRVASLLVVSALVLLLAR